MEPVWKKQYKLMQHPPPSQDFPRPLTPPTPLEIPIPSVGGVWIFSGTTHFRSTLKRDDFFAYVYFLNLTVLSSYVSL